MIENKEMKLSVIVPVYNVEQYIRPCLESIYKQGLLDSEFEVILVNDGTSDGSLTVVSDIINGHSNIKLIEQENQGPSVARNKGIENALGKYILFVDSDDLLCEKVLPKLLNKAINSFADILVGDYFRLTSDEINRNYYGAIINESYIVKSGFNLYVEDLNPSQCYLWRTLYRKDFLSENKLTAVMEGFCFEDIPFVHECYIKAGLCIKTDQKMYIYRVGHDSLTSSMNKRKLLDLNNSLVKLWNLRKIPEMSVRVRRRLDDNIFVTFSFCLWCVSHDLFFVNDRLDVIEDLKSKIPDIFFYNGFKQRFVSWMFWKHPCVYLTFRSIKMNKIFG